MQRGFVSSVYENKEECLKAAIATATLIAEKSPVAVSTTKRSIIYSRDHSVQEGLDNICVLNAAMLQTEDLAISAMASMSKQKPHFNKL